MPGASGLQLLQAVRARREFKDIPFVILTAEQEKSSILEAVRSGANGYLVKPPKPWELDFRIQSLVSTKRLADLTKKKN